MENQKFGKLSFGEKFGYSLGDTAANLAWRPLMAFLPIFYTDTFHLPATAVGLLLVLTRSFDGITDVIMGTIADRTNTRWGKFRPYLLWTAIPFGLLLALTFTAPDFTTTGKLVWAYTTYVLLTLAYTANNVPYSSLSGVMTGNILERTSVSSFRFFGAYLGGLISIGFLPKLVEIIGKKLAPAGSAKNIVDAFGYQYTFYILAFLLVVFSLIAFGSTKERIKPPKSQKSNFKAEFSDLMKNRPWIIMLIVGFLWVTYNSIRQGAAPYYFKWYLGRETMVGVFFIGVILASMVSSIIATPLTNYFGKRRLFILVMIVSGLFTCGIYFIPPNNIPMFFVLGILAELAAGIMPILFFAMLGDTADYSEFTHNRRATGLTFSAGTFAMKFGGGMAGVAMMLVLRLQGYFGEASEQSAKALNGIRLINSFVPVIFIIIAILIIFLYPLTTDKMKEIETELKMRKEKEETA
jgi:glycoside/pentoside/hexuronide:cation symporter, GPH family